MTFREEFEQSISQGMKLTKRTFLNILACDISTGGYADRVLAELEAVGCIKAREYYERIKEEWQQKHDEKMKNVAEWYSKQDTRPERKADTDWKKKREVELRKKELMKKSDEELLNLLQNLKQKFQ